VGGEGGRENGCESKEMVMRKKKKKKGMMLYISLPLQGLLLLLSLFYEMCEKKITFSCTRSFRGSNGTLYTVLSISLSFSWTFPREKS
jgi:hypothetical protein